MGPTPTPWFFVTWQVQRRDAGRHSQIEAAHPEARLVLHSAGHELGRADFAADLTLVSKPFQIDDIGALATTVLKSKNHVTEERGK